MTVPIITYEIPMNQVRAEIEAAENRLERQLNEAVDDILVYARLVQAESYLSDAHPQKPPGSKYERTFTLREASETRRTGTNLPDISGEWYIDEGIAPYGAEVIGPQAQQSPIHRGRWKSQEEIESAIETRAPVIVQEKLK